MKKRAYEKPLIKVLELQHLTHLLAGSAPSAPDYNDWLGAPRRRNNELENAKGENEEELEDNDSIIMYRHDPMDFIPKAFKNIWGD